MSNVTKFQEQNGMSVFSKPNALQEAESALLQAIKNALLRSYFELNQVVPEQEELVFLVNSVLDSILDRYTSIRAEEIAEAFSSGIRGDYGKYYGICLISIEQFIEGYLNSPERKEKAREHYKSLEQKSEPTKDEKFLTAKKLALEAFDAVSKGRTPGLTSVTVYEFLNGIGLVPKEYKKDVYRPAMEELITEKEREIVFCMDPAKRRLLNIRLEEFRENIKRDGITEQQHAEVIRTGKRMILLSLMRDWVLDEVNLDDLIESKRKEYAR